MPLTACLIDGIVDAVIVSESKIRIVGSNDNIRSTYGPKGQPTPVVRTSVQEWCPGAAFHKLSKLLILLYFKRREFSNTNADTNFFQPSVRLARPAKVSLACIFGAWIQRKCAHRGASAIVTATGSAGAGVVANSATQAPGGIHNGIRLDEDIAAL